MSQRGPLGRIVAAGLLTGAVAGLGAGAIDALWSWRHLGQFLPDAGGRLRMVAFVAAACGLAGAMIGATTTAALAALARLTRLGDLLDGGARLHREARARDPRDALIGLSLALAGVPVVAAALASAYLAAVPLLAPRKHIGLVIASAMGIAIVALLAAGVLTFVIARPIELGLRRLARGRAARWLSAPAAPSVAAVALIGLAGIAAVIASWSTLQLLPLRPVWVVLGALVLAWPAWDAAGRIADRLARLRPARQLALLAAPVVLLLALLLMAGESEGVRKASNAYTGLGGPLTRAVRTLGDLDRDGYSRLLGGGDCNDWDASVHPGAREIPDDGIDQNCVGGDASLARDPADVAFAEVPSTVPENLNVILITIDTVRWDHFGAYGYERDTSPRIDEIAHDGTVFINGWAHAPSTRYSIPAILTGRYPLEVRYDHSVRGWPGLSAENTTIAEIMKARGRRTGAILNYWYFDRQRRMDQGFDSYDNTNKRLHQGVPGEGPAHTRGSSSKQQTDKAIEFLDGVGGQPFFLWVHYYDPHYEYESHAEVPAFGGANPSKRDLYDREIRFTDLHIGRLVDELRARGLYDDTAIVITGDHGEGFGEHGIDLHGYHLYAAQTRVPFIIRVPGTEPRRVEMPAGHVDILPTLANLVGAAPDADMMGRSLLDVITGQTPGDTDRWVFQQLSYENNNEYRGAASRQCHVLYNVSPHTSWELYQIDIDPLESRDIIGAPGPCAGAREVLERWYDQSEIPAGAAEALLSGKPALEDPVEVDFGDEVRLLEAKVTPLATSRGERANIRLTWEARDALPGGWKVFVHFRGPGGAYFQADHAPPRPLEWWRAGQFIRYTHPVTVPQDARPGDYQMTLGLFRKQGNQWVRRPARGSVPIADDAATVGTLRVTP